MAIKFTTRVVPGKVTLDALRRNVTANPNFVKVGLPDSPNQDGNLTIAKLGMIHEYGAPSVNILERPFLFSAIREGAAEINRLNESVMADV